MEAGRRFGSGSTVPAVNEAAQPGGHTKRRRDIQGLRAVAVLLVVLFHADLGFSGGFVGVDVFFVISGFVITAMLLPELGGTGSLKLGHFYLRRIRRLVPALALLVVVIALVGILAAPVGIQQIAARTGGAASVFLGNAYLYLVPDGYFAASSDLNPFLHTWSLAVEEQFYLVFPLLLLGAWKLGARRGRSTAVAVATLIVVGTASLALAVLMLDGHTLPGISEPKAFAFFSSITRAWEFAAGSLLAFAAARVSIAPPLATRVAGWLGIALVVGVALRYDEQTLFPGLAAIPPVLGTVLILGAGIGRPATDSTADRTGVGRWLSLPPVVFLGDISYSWYLWHWPLIVYARAVWPGSFSAPLAAVISLLPAWLSFRLVENPIRFNTTAAPRRTIALGITAITLALVACGALVIGNRAVQQSQGYRSVQVALRGHRACPQRATNRVDLLPTDPKLAVRCTWDAPNALGVVALLGDSNAGHIVEPVVKAARAEDRSAYVAISNGCPFVDVTVIELREPRTDCGAFYRSSLRIIEQTRPALVVIGSSTTRYLGEPEFTLRSGDAGPTAVTSDEKARVWEQGMHRTVTRLARSDIPTLVIHPVPKYPGWDLRGCAAGRVVASEFTCGRAMSLATAMRSGKSSKAAQLAAIRGVGNVRSVGFLPELCTPRKCATSLGTTWLYQDGDHLSVKGSLRLAAKFERIFAAMTDR